MASVVAVFDFDKTLIDCDSDDWVVQHLGITDAFLQLQPTLPLNSVMKEMMKEIHTREKTIEDITECLKKVPFNSNIISAIRSAYVSGSELRIVSDANTFFIETILQHHGIRDCFSGIHTNPSYVDEQGMLRILPYYDFKSFGDHGCVICPSNMCKGLVMERIRDSVGSEGNKRFIYVGDGTPDICASLNLVEDDFVMARKDFPLWEFIYSSRELIKANFEEWRDGVEFNSNLFNIIKTIIIQDEYNNGRTDPLVPIDCKFQTIYATNALPAPR